jgi:hypothetical protein
MLTGFGMSCGADGAPAGAALALPVAVARPTTASAEATRQQVRLLLDFDILLPFAEYDVIGLLQYVYSNVAKETRGSKHPSHASCPGYLRLYADEAGTTPAGRRELSRLPPAIRGRGRDNS